MTGVLVRRWPCGDRDTWGEGSGHHVMMKTDLGVIHWPADHQSQDEARKDFSAGFRGSMALPPP